MINQLDFDQMATDEIFEAIEASYEIKGLALTIVHKDGHVTTMRKHKDSAGAYALYGVLEELKRTLLLSQQQEDEEE